MVRERERENYAGEGVEREKIFQDCENTTANGE
jgi:hypothetical protein